MSKTTYSFYGMQPNGQSTEGGDVPPVFQALGVWPSEKPPQTERTIHVVFDGPPGPTSGRFVEVETPDGRSVNVGEWKRREDGYWVLVLNVLADDVRG